MLRIATCSWRSIDELKLLDKGSPSLSLSRQDASGSGDWLLIYTNVLRNCISFYERIHDQSFALVCIFTRFPCVKHYLRLNLMTKNSKSIYKFKTQRKAEILQNFVHRISSLWDMYMSNFTAAIFCIILFGVSHIDSLSKCIQSNWQTLCTLPSECVFPFEFQGETHDWCISRLSIYSWCSLDRYYSGNWVYCTSFWHRDFIGMFYACNRKKSKKS